MAGTILLTALAGLGKAAVSDAAKQWVKDWLTDAMRVRRAIQRTAASFSTQLPDAQDALVVWVQTEAFRAAMEDLIAGRALPEQLTPVDEFLAATGLSFGTASPEVVRDLLTVLFGNIREDMVSARPGLILVDNRMGELLRQFQEIRADLAGQGLPGAGAMQADIQRTSTAILDQVAYTQGWGSGLGYGAEVHVNLELPPSVQNLATRASAVRAIRDALKSTAWYAIYGGSGSGKTQLAILTACAFPGRKIWMRLGGSPRTAGLILESALAKLAARPSGQSTESWFDAACSALGPDALIVLDDLPYTSGDAAIAEQLARLCSSCVNTGVRLLTTSAGPLAPGTRAIGGNRVHEEEVPGFRDQDVHDLFRAYGATDPFLASPWFGFVLGAARRHPVLLVEAARYLRARGWATDDRSFDDLARGSFASALDVPTVERILQTVPDAATREFLYRLKVIGWPFGIEEVERISAVSPAVTLPLERLATVIGLWVQKDSVREYVLSPLIVRLTDDYLPKDLQQAIHLALARGILEKRRIGPDQAIQAVTHFVAAGDTNSAAVVVLVALHGTLRMSDATDPFGIATIWAGMPLPGDISLEKRIYLRVLQVILRRRLDLDEQFELADLERLMKEGDTDNDCQLVIAAGGAMLASYLGDHDPELAIRSVARSMKASRRVGSESPRDPELAVDSGLLTLLWAIPAWIRSEAQYQQWFAAVRDLTPDESRQWRGLPLAGHASNAVCGGLWSRMADLPEAERNWPRVRDQLEQLQAWAQSAGITCLATSALLGQIIVLAEYQQALLLADSIARAGMKEFHDLPRSLFLIADAIARQHYYFGEAADAVRWFDAALAYQDAASAAARVGSFTLAGVTAHALSFDRAREYLEQGVAAATAGGVGAMARVTVRGELGILLWNAGQQGESYITWSAAAQELLAARQDTRAWKTLFRLFGNCTGYFLGGLRGVNAGNAEMTVPFAGILLRDVKDIDQLHDPELDWLLPVQMALLAERIGAYDEAVTWAQRTIVGGGALKTGAHALLAGALTAGDLAAKRWAQIVRAADLGDLDDVQAEGLARLDEERQAQQVARFTARLTLVALAIEIARVGLQGHITSQPIDPSPAELSRDCATRYGASRMWSGVAEVFEALADRSGSWRELWDKALAARAQGNSALQVMYGIAAMTNAGPREAVQIQLQTVPWVERLFSPTLYHVTMTKFVPEYWRWALDQCPMSFGSPNRTRQAISEAQGLKDKPTVHFVLRAVVFSLGVHVPDHVQRWLEGDD
jgi:tetratricopeptide (TPR) repeat protein